MTVELSILAGMRPFAPARFLIEEATAADLRAYRRLRRNEFVYRQGLFAHTDHDDVDDDPRTVVLVAVTADRQVLGGVRLAPRTDPDIGWWSGSRLAVVAAEHSHGVGPALIRAACAYAESRHALRFDATVQRRYRALFARLGWQELAETTVAGLAHVHMLWPIDRAQRLADDTKAMLAQVLAPLGGQPDGLGPSGFRGDDGVPVSGSTMIAACDAILPAMVERDPEWAGWCSVLVNLNDLAAMGATPVGLLDAVAAPTTSHLTRIVRGLARAAEAWGVPVLGGHTQVGVHASLAVTALGTTPRPVRAGAGSVGAPLCLTADLTGSWRAGYDGRQWDSTSMRSGAELRALGSVVAEMQATAAKDVSMAGIVGTTGMLAEASGTGAVIDVARVPRPRDAAMGAWLTCFPGFGMVTTGGHEPRLPAGVASVTCGELVAQPGVSLRWPDGVTTRAVGPTVTGLGTA